MKTQKKAAKCSNCQYTWGTRSTKRFVTCPNCLVKVELKEGYNRKEHNQFGENSI